MYAAACLVVWYGSAAGWRMLALAMGEAPAAPCPAMEMQVEQQAVDAVKWRMMLRAALASQAFGARAATATALASGASGTPTPRRSASEIAAATLSAAGPPRDGPLHCRELVERAHHGDGERFHGEAVRLLGLHGVAGAKALRVLFWVLGCLGLLEVAPQPSGDEGKEEEGAPDIFRGLTPLGEQVATQLGSGGGSDHVAEAAIGTVVAALTTAASGRGPLRAALEAPEVCWLRRIRRAIRQLEERLRHSPRVHELCAYGGQGRGRRCRSRAWPGALAQGLPPF